MRNSVKYQMIQADTTTRFFRDHIRDFCKGQGYKGLLLDLYNKTYQLNDIGLYRYLDTRVSARLFSRLVSSY
jgi:hypothetical protein